MHYSHKCFVIDGQNDITAETRKLKLNILDIKVQISIDSDSRLFSDIRKNTMQRYHAVNVFIVAIFLPTFFH